MIVSENIVWDNQLLTRHGTMIWVSLLGIRVLNHRVRELTGYGGYVIMHGQRASDFPTCLKMLEEDLRAFPPSADRPKAGHGRRRKRVGPKD